MSHYFFRKNFLVFLLVLIFSVAILTACGCEHQWAAADCQKPQTCSLCNKTMGEIGDHAWVEADCVNPKTCSVCGVTEGDALGHDYSEATCTEAEICKTCGDIKGEPLGHDWTPVSFEAPKTCKICGETEGGVLTVTEYDISTYFSFAPWGYIATDDTVIACDKNYNFGIYDWEGNLIREIDFEIGKGLYGWNYMSRTLADAIFTTTSLVDDGIDLTIFDKNGNFLYETVYPYENIINSRGEDAMVALKKEGPNTAYLSDEYFAVCTNDHSKIFCVVNTTDFSIIAPEDFDFDFGYDSTVFTDCEWLPYVDMYIAAWNDTYEFGYLDSDMNVIKKYIDASPFSKDGFALVKNGSRYSLIDKDFNVIVDDFVDGRDAFVAYCYSNDYLRIEYDNGDKVFYKVTVTE